MEHSHEDLCYEMEQVVLEPLGRGRKLVKGCHHLVLVGILKGAWGATH